MKERYSVEEVCERYGVTARTLHYYEEIGLLNDVPRTEGGHRYYDERIIVQLEQIIRLKEVLGISLQEVKTIVELEAKLEQIRGAYRQEDKAEEKTKILDRGEQELQRFIDQIDSRLDKLQQLRQGFQQRLDRVKKLKETGAPQGS
ncbi:DNA-binding transcriptional MerR regulator [Paenibacillus cellulosilyticus]|uniref:DNA-binding transcriptional MerR regulator n=1 Tax=Paenibacillus cellulosilyticus TaxID=375489 RepID=A0A2V2YU05_9BACL|nr:MerR family transcriptional regulator [Paenibacillus cellulosilyticus]PWW03156.1 DNA-binding transcriptional MerR regulator [Paenibacillus cellulosilyticus]QKS43653.1 MerR family transcriptional regulator [Paenibacillus cellulosilyticus]